MKVICGADDIVGPWVCQRTGGAWFPGGRVTIGNARDDGTLLAGAIYDNCYPGASCAVHLAAEPGGITREFLWYGFWYPFRELKVRKLIGMVSSANTKAVKLNLHFGYIIEGVITCACPDGDLVLMTMTPEQCRFLERSRLYGQAIRTRAA